MFFDKDDIRDTIENELEAKTREKDTHRKRRDYVKREKSKFHDEDKFERIKNKKRKYSKKSKYHRYEMEE